MDSISVVNTPLYEETFVSHTPYFHKEISGVPYGDAGETVSYSIATDSYATMALLLCILLSVISIAKSINFVHFQFRNLFRIPRENSIEMRETADEMQYQFFFCIQSILMLGIISHSAIEDYLGKDFIVNDYLMIAILSGVFGAYYFLHEVLYFLVHITYFPLAQRHIFYVSRLFLYAMQGALFLPITLVHVYFHVDIKTTVYCALGVIFSTLFIRFYKLYNTFFKKNGHFLQFFLYLCTLEAVPLTLLGIVVLIIANYLKINI